MKKKIFSVFCSALLVVCIAAGCVAQQKSVSTGSEKIIIDVLTPPHRVSIFSKPIVSRVAGIKQRIEDVSTFSYHKGEMDVDKQKQFELTINETEFLDEDKVEQLNAAGTITIGTLSIGADFTAPNAGDGLTEAANSTSYRIYEDGEAAYNADENYYYVNAGSPSWQYMVMAKAARIFENYEIDGLLLNYTESADIYQDTIGGMASLIINLNKRFPDKYLILSRAGALKYASRESDELTRYVSDVIDGLYYENFNTSVRDYKITEGDGITYVHPLNNEEHLLQNWYAIYRINEIRKYDYFPVFALDYANESDLEYITSTIRSYYNKSWQYDFISYVTTSLDDSKVVRIMDGANPAGPSSSTKRGDYALQGDAGEPETPPNIENPEDNIAYIRNGGTVHVQTTHPNYSKAPLNDGLIYGKANHNQNLWATSSWASAADEIDHQVEVWFAKKATLASITIYWAADGSGEPYSYSPREFYILADNMPLFGGDGWGIIAEWNNIPPEGINANGDNYIANQDFTRLEFRMPINTGKIRIVMPAGMGAHDNTNLPTSKKTHLWISEIVVYPVK